MSQVMVTMGIISVGQYVRTSTGRIGRVVEVTREYAPHEMSYEWHVDGWLGNGDETWHHVYVVEFLDTWGEPFTERWPEDYLSAASVLDAVAG